jgi:hypothetical protein
MPSLSDRLSSGVDMSGYGPVSTPDPAQPVSIPNTNQTPGFSPYTRCPLPLVSNTNSDAQRTYYQNGVVPQYRVLNPPAAQVQNVTNTTNVTQKVTQQIASVLAGTGTIANPGSIVIPVTGQNSLIINWGVTPTPTASGVQPAISFLNPFVNNFFGLAFGGIQIAAQHTMVPSVVDGSETLTGFTWTTGTGTDTDGLCPTFWWAWGN